MRDPIADPIRSFFGRLYRRKEGEAFVGLLPPDTDRDHKIYTLHRSKGLLGDVIILPIGAFHPRTMPCFESLVLAISLSRKERIVVRVLG